MKGYTVRYERGEGETINYCIEPCEIELMTPDRRKAFMTAAEARRWASLTVASNGVEVQSCGRPEPRPVS